MPSTFTGSGIELIADGEQSGVWGQTTNDNLQIINRLVSEAGSIALSGTTHTLTISNGILSDGQYGVLVFGGSPSGTNTVTVSPNDAKRVFIVKNTTGESVVLTQGSGGNVTIPASAFKIVYTDGGGAGAAVVDVTSVVDINGGTIDGVTIGGASAGAATFTSAAVNGNITVTGTVDGRDVATDGSKLDGIEAGADVTDTANVTAAGALMDSELTNITAVKALNQGVATTDSPSFAGLTATTADINGGTIDGAVIGGSTPAAITGTTGTFSGNVSISDKIIHTGDTNTAIRFPAADTVTVETSGSERLRVTSTGTVGILTTTPAATLDVAGTGAIKVPVGTEAQRPTPATGQLRFNDDIDKFEGYDGTAWGTVGGGGGFFKGENGSVGDATTGPGDIFRINEQELNTSVTISGTENASCTGPLAVASGVTLTVSAGGTLAVI
jgi:hypothetical protein